MMRINHGPTVIVNVRATTKKQLKIVIKFENLINNQQLRNNTIINFSKNKKKHYFKKEVKF